MIVGDVCYAFIRVGGHIAVGVVAVCTAIWHGFETTCHVTAFGYGVQFVADIVTIRAIYWGGSGRKENTLSATTVFFLSAMSRNVWIILLIIILCDWNWYFP